MKIIKTVVLIFFSICLPFVAFMVSANLVVRMPDVYQYEFKASNFDENTELPYSNNEISNLISDFMIWNNDNLSLHSISEEQIGEYEFSKKEVRLAEKIRRVLDIEAFFSVILVVYSIIVLIYGRKKLHDKEMRKYINGSLKIYLGFMILYFGFFFFINKNPFVLLTSFDYQMNEHEILYQIVSKTLLLRIYIVIGIVATIIMGVCSYILMKLFKPKRVFTRS